MNFKRLSKNGWCLEARRHSASGKLIHADSQQSLGSQEYREFKMKGFTHHDLKGLTRIPTHEHRKKNKKDEVSDDTDSTPRESMSRLSSQETLAPQELLHQPLSTSTSVIDNLKKVSDESEMEKGSVGIAPPRDPGRDRPEVFETTFKEIIFLCCMLVSLAMAVSDDPERI